MKKYRYAYCVVLISAIVILSGCGSVTASLQDDIQEETGTNNSSSLYDESDSEQETELSEPGENIVTDEPTPYPEITPLPSPEPVAADIPPADINETPVSVSEPAVSASPTPVPDSNRSEFMYPVKNFSDENRLCLTFDDGGNRKAVEKVLETLKKHDVKATFFIIGKYLKPNANLWKQAVEDGHLVCNHTQNHVWLTQLNSEDAKKEILEWESSAAEILGREYVEKMKQDFPFIRLPGGAGNDSKRILRIVSELGYIPVGWSIESYYAVLRHHDLKTEPVGPIAEEVFAHVTKKAKGGSIVLLHFNPYDTEKLDDIITAVKDKGITIDLLSECLEY